MAFTIKSVEADRLVRQLGAITGESLTEAVIHSPRERLKRHKPAARNKSAGTQLARMAETLRKLPVLDSRTASELLAYGEDGLPTKSSP